jgi:hypothetical protein
VTALVGTNGKEKVIAALHHPHQHLLYQAVVRIDQHVVSLEAIEVKNELNDFRLPIHSQFWQKPTDVTRVIASLRHCFRVVTAQLPIYAGNLISTSSGPISPGSKLKGSNGARGVEAA